MSKSNDNIETEPILVEEEDTIIQKPKRTLNENQKKQLL